ncbi:armadillo repeat-containing 2 isoform X1 [Pelobates cultripes]|nr:armadillo repeat-containing 2 isoform X1 [Pelobates cultripes]
MMQPSRDRDQDPFYKPPISVQKTSAEIINEARRALRTLRTQRPFTPRDNQRKLFGSTSSRTADNRPPSAFSLHASSFETSDSRPVSGTRLSPLPHKPKLPESPPVEDEGVIPFPQPPAQAKGASLSRSRLFRALSHGNIRDDSDILPDDGRNPQCYEDMSPLSKADLEEFDTSLGVNNNPLQIHNVKNIPHKQGEDSKDPYTPSNKNECGIKNRPSPCPSYAETALLGSKTVSESESTLNETETEDETIYWNEKVLPILQDLQTAQQDRSVDDLCHICTNLHKVLENGNMLEKRCKRRALILKTLYKLVEIGSDKLGLIVAKLILALKVSGKNLLNICKLIFKISRTENNDCLFQNNDIIDSLMEVLQSEDVQANSEAFVYCLGTIKFLSGNSVILNELLQKQSVEILVELMKHVIQSNKISDIGSSVDMGHLLVQLTATLRNLADLAPSRPKFIANNALAVLCLLLDIYIKDEDICTNVSRILSKLSSYNDCCLALAECITCYSSFLSVLKSHLKKQDLVVRVVFILGNLTAKNNKAREEFYKHKRSITTLLYLLHFYCELDRKLQKIHKKEESKRPSEVEDILLKVIRLLANLSVHPTIGTDLAANEGCVSLLMQVLEYKPIDECDELVINTVATVNNLSYYQGDSSVIVVRRLDISKLLLKLLLCNNMDGILEVARVFGNLSRYQDVRDFIVEQSVYKYMTTLVDAKHQDVCFSACGVLINLTADRNKRALLKDDGGIKKLLDCLRDFGRSDWQLAGLVCKVFWNLSENITNAELCFGKEETITLLGLLSSFLDEQVVLDYRWNVDLMEYHKSCWKLEFKPVAIELLNRIQSYHSYLEPLPGPV